LDIDSQQPQGWLTLAGICVELGETDDAEQAYLSALRAAPNLPQAFTGLGLLYTEQRRHHEAAHFLNAAINSGVDSFGVHACLGQTMLLLGEFEKGDFCFQRAAQLQPHDERLLKKLRQTSLMKTLLVQPPQEALRLYQTQLGCEEDVALAAGREAFHYFVGYGYDAPAIRLGDFLLNRDGNDAIISYQLDALKGHALERAPETFLTAYFDKFADTFDKQLVENLNYRVPEDCCEQLAKLGRSFANILDIGCGTGLAAPYLAKLGVPLSGVDISARMLEKAEQRRCYDHLFKAEAVDYLKGSTNVFELVVAFDMLIYFGNLRPLFTNVARRLAPNGIFAISYETGASKDFKLRSCGRFGHSPAYIREIAQEEFEFLSERTTVLRLEAARPVDGRIALLRRR